jgi:glycosyltransferase involved in cell wall biosynthesis
MVRAFRQLGHEVRVIGPVGENPPGASSRSQVLQQVKRRIPHVFFEFLEMLYTGYCFAKTAAAARSFRPDFIYDRYITFNAGVVLAGIACRVPVFLEVNAPLAMERSVEKDERLIFRSVAARLEKWICSRSSRTIVVSTPLKEYLNTLGVPQEKCVVMPNGVDPERFRPAPRNSLQRAALEISDDEFVVGFTGVLRPWHGLDLLVDAFRKLVAEGVHASLLIVGDGPYRGELEILLEEKGMKGRARITGHVPHENVPDYVSLFDVAVSPRATFYASPMKVIEYMALGKPVVVPYTRNFLDIIDDGLNGVTFEDGNAKSLEATLLSLCRNPDWCQKLGRNARQKVENRLNWRWNASEVCRLFREELPATSPVIED